MALDRKMSTRQLSNRLASFHESLAWVYLGKRIGASMGETNPWVTKAQEILQEISLCGALDDSELMRLNGYLEEAINASSEPDSPEEEHEFGDD